MYISFITFSVGYPSDLNLSLIVFGWLLSHVFLIHFLFVFLGQTLFIYAIYCAMITCDVLPKPTLLYLCKMFIYIAKEIKALI